MKLGSNDISAVKIGSTDVNKIYIGSTEVWSSMDADYRAILDYATSQGYTLPSESQRLLQEQLVIDLKDAGIWNKLDTFAVFATDGDSDFALIDWIRLTDYTVVNSPTFVSNLGYLGDGVTACIATGLNLRNSGLNWSDTNGGIIGGYFYEMGTSGLYKVGTGGDTYLRDRRQPRVDVKMASSTIKVYVTSNPIIGNLAEIRINSTQISLYNNATILQDGVGLNADSNSGLDLTFVAYSNTGFESDDSGISIGYAGGIKTDSDYLALNTATQNYISEL